MSFFRAIFYLKKAYWVRFELTASASTD